MLGKIILLTNILIIARSLDRVNGEATDDIVEFEDDINYEEWDYKDHGDDWARNWKACGRDF